MSSISGRMATRRAVEAPHRSVSLSFDSDVTAGRSARRAIQELLDDDVPVNVTRDAILLTSELVTNAVMHSQGRFHLSATFHPSRGVLRVEVVDPSPQLPVMAESRTSRVGGLGLRLVNEVADRWGSSLLAAGKVVWFELSSKDDDPGVLH